MFYSQTFLARKGPLGTVWCAAHLQHRLKKSHYTSTNISATVDLIMFPEVPLALRMSGHLLLGVVRIYSKKVDYLFHDCNVVLTWLAKAFASTQVNLPEEARQAPVESVTLPETLNLDDFNFDDDTLERDSDSHLRSQEEITLTDQIPTDTDPYVAITFDEDIFRDLRPMDVDSHSTVPVIGDPDNAVGETDVVMPAKEAEPNNQPGTSDVAMDPKVSAPDDETEEAAVNMEFQDSGLNNSTGVLNAGNTNANSPRTAPEIEKMRDAAHDLSPGIHPPFAPDQMNDTVELTECLDEALKEKENPTPVIDEEILVSGGNSPFQLRSESLAFSVHEEPVNFRHSSPRMALRSTPPPAQQQPEPRPRKRKLLFDKATVLTNRIMRQRLEDPSDILRRRRNMPSRQPGLWRHNNRSRKEQMFNEPLLTGFSDDLRNVFEKDYVASKPYLVVDHAALPETMAAVSPTRETETEVNPEFTTVQSPTVVLSHTQETETVAIQDFTVLQSPPATEANLNGRVQNSPTQDTQAIPEFTVPLSPHPGSEATIAQSSQSFGNIGMEIEHLRDAGFPEFMQSPTGFSPVRTDEFTPQLRTSGTATTTPAFTAETASYGTEPETPRTIPEDLPGLGNFELPDIPEIDEELSFLEGVSDTPAGSPASQQSDALSVRTRALARYLRDFSSSSPTSKGPSEDLSLNKILEGKTRKLSARMFFETLVLKTNRLIDVQQDKPYGDITLKLMPALFSKAQL